jgi:hypothetical protein
MSTKLKFCNFCNKYNHLSRDCNLEKELYIKLKLLVGNMMEYYIADNIKCPECNYKSLFVIGNNTPSCDIICNNCNKIYEIKSKCLSCVNLLDDIIINHGHYNKFI